MRSLIFNPGSNSLKFEVIDTRPRQTVAGEAAKQLSCMIEGIGKSEATLAQMEGGETVVEEKIQAEDMEAATHRALAWVERKGYHPRDLSFVGVRVVHGGPYFKGAVRWTGKTREKIQCLEELAPLHNKSSIQIIDAVTQALPDKPTAITLDTAFHKTIPEIAWRYPIEKELADRHGIRKFGFHGVSHRYLLERYAQLHSTSPFTISLVSLHLESGSSACAIRNGESVDTSMGLTPLEGLMMGSRSGSVDPAIVEVLMRKERVDSDGALQILNRRSGLKGIGGNLDTRVLAKSTTPDAKLALEMYSYRVRLWVGAYLATLGQPQALIFGAGIGEDSPSIREAVCNGLQGFGLELDEAANRSAVRGEAKISAPGSSLEVWAMPTEECLQIAHECSPLFETGPASV